MTPGQKRALNELCRLVQASNDDIHLSQDPYLSKNGLLIAVFSVRIGPILSKKGGLEFHDREEFTLIVPDDFPFKRPWLKVDHFRFSNFPHVIWGKGICLYQSDIEWVPADGLFGFFDKFHEWIEKAALNEMDPIDGPLEPPHHDTDFNQNPFVIRKNAPCRAGERWNGLAILENYENRIELIGWNRPDDELKANSWFAPTVILPKPLPTFEFPTKGSELFHALEEAGMDKEEALHNLGLAALFTRPGEPIHLVIGLPMRRGPDGSERIHFAVWSTEHNLADSLKSAFPNHNDPQKIKELRGKLKEILGAIFDLSKIKWCQVFEDRPEIIVERDVLTPASKIKNKNILILGCGALGSWVSEFLIRAKPSNMELVDNGKVSPGLLVRQNYTLDDIGSNKAVALAKRLNSISHNTSITAHQLEAHEFILKNKDRLNKFDLIIDCTASNIFQMKIERDWPLLLGKTPTVISLIIDGETKHCLCVYIKPGSQGGIWNGYISLKYQLCIQGRAQKIIDAFYSENSTKKYFQPEPGCSNPTFSGSSLDITSLLSSAINNALSRISEDKESDFGFAVSSPSISERSNEHALFKSPNYLKEEMGNYRVMISDIVFTQAKSWVNKVNRDYGPNYETGGLLWGFWDDAIRTIWIFDLSGPPPDSVHDKGHFLCGKKGTLKDHNIRFSRSLGTCGYIGLWHTHPEMSSIESCEDMNSMISLVAPSGNAVSRLLMLIFGTSSGKSTAGLYLYENNSLSKGGKVSIAEKQFILPDSIL